MSPRRPRAFAIRAMAVILGLATARVVALDLATIHDQAHRLGALRHVVVARATLMKGAVVRDADVTTVSRHSSEVPNDTVASPAAVVGRTIVVDVAAGAPILRANIARHGTGPSAALPPDRRAIRLVDAGGLAPAVGSIVDVYATYDAATSARANESATLVARGAVVLQVDADGGATPHTTSASGTTSGLVVMIRSGETRAVASAIANGVVTVVIAPVEDACCADP